MRCVFQGEYTTYTTVELSSVQTHTHTYSPLQHEPYVIFSLLEMFGGQVTSMQSVADIYYIIIRHFYHTKYHPRRKHVLCSLIKVISSSPGMVIRQTLLEFPKKSKCNQIHLLLIHYHYKDIVSTKGFGLKLDRLKRGNSLAKRFGPKSPDHQIAGENPVSNQSSV